MRFAFTDDQLAFRDAVRDLLANECPPSAVRAPRGTTPTVAVVAHGTRSRRWACSARLAPEADGGLGLAPLDLVLIVEETGYAALPEPFVEHAPRRDPGAARPTIPASRRQRQGRSRSPRRSGAIPYAPYAESADAILVDDDDTLLLIAHADAVLAPTTSVDRARRLAWVEWEPARADRRRSRARRRLRPWRARRGRATHRPRPPHARPHRRIREGAPAVRRTDRQLPSRQAPSRRRPHRHRVRPPARVPRRVVGHPRRSRRLDPCVHGQGPGQRRRHADGPPGAPVPRRHRLLVRIRPAPVHETGVGTRRPRGETPRGIGPEWDVRSCKESDSPDPTNPSTKHERF